MPKFKIIKILFTGGGTGGHLFPFIAVAHALRQEIKKAPLHDVEIAFIGPKIEEKVWEQLLVEAGIRIISVLTGKLRRYASSKNFYDVAIKAPLGVLHGLWKVFWNMPDVTFSKGGYGSVPAIIASSLYGIPIMIHDSDAIPGAANQVMAKHATIVALGFKEAREYFKKNKNVLLTGNPVRPELLAGSAEIARQQFNVKSKKPVILVIGASQGAEAINDLILNNLEELLASFEVIHVTGAKKFRTLGSELQARFGHIDTGTYHPYPFLAHELKEAYAIANAVVSRASASSIFEIAGNQKPSVLIPLALAAQDHQRANAYAYAQTGAALVMEETNATIHLLISHLTEIINNAELNSSMRAAAKAFYIPDAATMIAEELLRLAGVKTRV